jgi:Flp pilus assembly pilin Flp
MNFNSLEGDRGAGLVEYALIVMLIAVVGVSAVGYLGEQTSDGYETAGAGFDADVAAELSPEEKWELAQADYDDALADAKATRADDKANAEAEYQVAFAANQALPNKERKAGNAVARAKRNDAYEVADADYNASVKAAKADRDAANADYNATK